MSGAVEVTKAGDVTVVTLSDEFSHLDVKKIDHLHQRLLEVAEEANPPLVVLNLPHTKFFGSEFIEILFRVWNRLRGTSGRFAICNLTDFCREVIDVTHLDRLWPVCGSVDEAVAALSAD